MVSPSNAAPLSAARFATRNTATSGRSTVPQPGRKSLTMRKYHIAALLDDGQVRISDQIGPAMPAFEAAFSAFAHGTLINTTRGQVPVEDLVPGMKLVTADKGPVQLMWVGAMTLVPRSGEFPGGGSLTRIMADSFGFGRPQADLLAGPGARLVRRSAGGGDTPGSDKVLTPAARLVDGVCAIEVVPPRPVTVYHLCLRRHAIIAAAGLEFESFHPGAGFERNMGPNMLSLFLSFFPHVRQARDFGALACPRLPLQDDEPVTDFA